MFDSAPDGGHKFASKRVVRPATETVRHPLPVIAVKCNLRAPPEVTPELGGDLDNDEPLYPGREAALPSELREFRDHGQHGVVGRLVRQIVQLWSCHSGPSTSTPDLTVVVTHVATGPRSPVDRRPDESGALLAPLAVARLNVGHTQVRKMTWCRPAGSSRPRSRLVRRRPPGFVMIHELESLTGYGFSSSSTVPPRTRD